MYVQLRRGSLFRVLTTFQHRAPKHSVTWQSLSTSSLSMASLQWGGSIKELLRSTKQYLKGDYKVHSVEASFVADHCRIYALSDPTNEEYRRTWNHVHNDSCPQCSQLQTLLSTLERKCSSEQLSEDDRAEMLHVFR
ncbi:unnamed protein product [Porites lobata]|uniref:Uncharacterized protein n=1 Tax=Porites lobata TaxID=104759 RepID=A0ABN8RHC2_9CNID|nr:unnamed protein product [Porites lobata]